MGIESTGKQPMWKRVVRWGLASIATLVALSCAGLLWLGNVARRQPEFYTKAERALVVAREKEIVPRLAVEAETQVLAAQQSVDQGADWSLAFRDDQANAWLQAELPKQLAGSLPAGVTEPRVAFEDGRLLLGWKQATIAGTDVVSIEASVAMTDRKNVAAIRVLSIRLGGLTLPRDQILSQVRQAAADQGLQIEWTGAGAETTALFSIDTLHEQGLHESIVVEQIECRPGVLTLSGRVETANHSEPPDR